VTKGSEGTGVLQKVGSRRGKEKGGGQVWKGDKILGSPECVAKNSMCIRWKVGGDAKGQGKETQPLQEGRDAIIRNETEKRE